VLPTVTLQPGSKEAETKKVNIFQLPYETASNSSAPSLLQLFLVSGWILAVFCFCFLVVFFFGLFVFLSVFLLLDCFHYYYYYYYYYFNFVLLFMSNRTFPNFYTIARLHSSLITDDGHYCCEKKKQQTN